MLGSARGLCGKDEKGSASATDGFDDALGGAMMGRKQRQIVATWRRRALEHVQDVLCEECEHLIDLHGPDGCEREPGDRWIDYPNGERLVALPPCGCRKHVRTSESIRPGTKY
jgi:hypothetical protein